MGKIWKISGEMMGYWMKTRIVGLEIDGNHDALMRDFIGNSSRHGYFFMVSLRNHEKTVQTCRGLTMLMITSELGCSLNRIYHLGVIGFIG